MTRTRWRHSTGTPTVYVTGSPLRDAVSLARDHDVAGLVVCSNGAVVAEAVGGRVLRRSGFPPGAAGKLLKRLRARVPDVVLGLDTVRGLHLERGFGELVPDCWPHEVVPDAATALSADDPPVKILAAHAAMQTGPLREILLRPGDAVEATHSTPYFVEISRRGTDKGTALRRLAHRYRVPVSATAAVGDMPNDLPMLRAAGVAVAVANAHPDLLSAAGLVVPGNGQEGVAAFLHAVCASLPPDTP